MQASRRLRNPREAKASLSPPQRVRLAWSRRSWRKLMGLRVVGMAGSDEKARYLVDELGLDAAFNYRTAASLEEALKEHCPDGMDIFFDLVGGEILDAALSQMKLGRRIPSAGMVSQYNLPHDQRYGLKNLHSIVGMEITIQSYRSSSWEHLVLEMRDELEV